MKIQKAKISREIYSKENIRSFLQFFDTLRNKNLSIDTIMNELTKKYN